MIEQVPILFDNYAYLIHDPLTGKTAAIDPAEPAPVLATLNLKGWNLDFIINTHHHADHSGGNLILKQKTAAQVIGAQADHDRIPGMDQPVEDGDIVRIGAIELEVMLIPGHTRGHLAFWWKSECVLFTGDMLFTGGCGRLFEGTPEQMWSSLLRLRRLPEETLIYCGHEYTEKNLSFALGIDSQNKVLQERYQKVCVLRKQGLPTVPATLELEKKTNPFLRADDTSWTAELPVDSADPVKVFAYLRQAKDHF